MASGQIPGHSWTPLYQQESHQRTSSPVPTPPAYRWCPEPPDTALHGPSRPNANARRVCRSFLSSDFLPPFTFLGLPFGHPPPKTLRALLAFEKCSGPCNASVRAPQRPEDLANWLIRIRTLKTLAQIQGPCIISIGSLPVSRAVRFASLKFDDDPKFRGRHHV